jgi:F-type H+-transporting ATPase subunit epsilon
VSDPLQVEMVAADRVVWSGEATMVSARTADGDIGILSDHAPILSIMLPYPVQITDVSGERILAAVDRGFLSVARNRVSILAEYIDLASDIDQGEAQRQLEEAQQASDLDDDERKFAIQRAEARLRVLELAR